MTATCSSCSAPILWARGVATGRGVPLDLDPVADGNIVIVPASDVPADLALGRNEVAVHYLRKGDDPGDRPRYVTHFSTCPDATTHRKRSR